MRILSYLLLAVLLVGCTRLYGQERPTPTPEQVKSIIRWAEQGFAGAQFTLGAMYGNGEGSSSRLPVSS